MNCNVSVSLACCDSQTRSDLFSPSLLSVTCLSHKTACTSSLDLKPWSLLHPSPNTWVHRPAFLEDVLVQDWVLPCPRLAWVNWVNFSLPHLSGDHRSVTDQDKTKVPRVWSCSCGLSSGCLLKVICISGNLPWF